MKTLIKLLPLIQAAHDSMKSGLERLADDVDDNIYSACMNGHVTGGGIPAIGTTSDKTGKIALQFRYSNRSDVKQLQYDVNLLSEIVNSIDNGFKILTKMQRIILDLRYPKGEERAWKEVVLELKKEEIFFSVSHTRKIHDYGIKCMIMAAQITVDTYNEAMEIMQGRD